MRIPIIALLFTGFLIGCGNENPSTVLSPGAEKDAKDHALDTGAALMQNKAPLEKIHAYVCGFHFYNGDMQRQVEAHHYCIQVNKEFHQCIIFDRNDENAKLIGIEYIISENLFTTLPEDEKKLWHSHHYEVKSGSLAAPGLPQAAEKELMENLVTTYGKTIHTWQIDRGDTLPLGAPQIMMGFTADGQANPQLVQDRDRRMDISTDGNRKNRESIPMPNVQPGANAWEQGQAMQLHLQQLASSSPSIQPATQ